MRSISLVRRLPPLLRLNVLPFVIAYAVLTALYLQSPPVPLDSVTSSISNSSVTATSSSPLIELNNDSSPSSSSSIERDVQASETREETEEEAAARATEEWMAEVEDWARRMSGENWAIAGALVALLHVLSLLVPHWSNTMDFFLTCYTVPSPSHASCRVSCRAVRCGAVVAHFFSCAFRWCDLRAGGRRQPSHVGQGGAQVQRQRER